MRSHAHIPYIHIYIYMLHIDTDTHTHTISHCQRVPYIAVLALAGSTPVIQGILGPSAVAWRLHQPPQQRAAGAPGEAAHGAHVAAAGEAVDTAPGRNSLRLVRQGLRTMTLLMYKTDMMCFFSSDINISRNYIARNE